MKKEIKEVVVNGNRYEFWFDEELNMWRISENNSLVDNYAIDIEIDLANLGKLIDWDEIARFIGFITGNRQRVNENIQEAQFVLGAFFKTIYKKAYADDFFNDVVFNLSGIDYKGLCKNVNLKNSIEYDFFFFPQYIKDIYKDIGSFVWRAHFRDNLLLGVYCDRL